MNHLRSLLTENTRLSAWRIGPSLVPIGRFSAFWPKLDPVLGEHHWDRRGGPARHVLRVRARSFAHLFCPFRFV